MISEDKLSSLHFVASLPLSGDDANPQLLTREQASELLACSMPNVSLVFVFVDFLSDIIGDPNRFCAA